MADAAVLILRKRFMQVDEYGVHYYIGKDNRVRGYVSDSSKTVSYPRILMSNYLGRTLKPDEQIHHMDGNPLNNDIDNLLVLPRELHELIHEHDYRKYYDKWMICPWCGEQFLWTAHSQSKHYGNKHRKTRPNMAGPFCSKSCAGSYGRHEQLHRKMMTECE